ncbi:MAG: hypothetical protein CMJ33_06650 [Phycisphaerae bacterium]|nr:hypothetical protein [Phycisphaerae bacterium]HAW96193.1 hypothetical protein [Phycisphaerales bacterium]
MDDSNIPTPELFAITNTDCRVVAEKLASDPEGLSASGHVAPRNMGEIERVIIDALGRGQKLWRIRVMDDLFGAIVGDDPFQEDEQRLFVWLDPKHRGNDLGIELVAGAIKKLEESGRERLIATPPRSNYAALRILNVLEFTYIGEKDPDAPGEEPTVLFERRPTKRSVTKNAP